MHPMMISALAHQVEKQRQAERRRLHLRQLAGEPNERRGTAPRRRLTAGISLWPRVS